MNMLISWIGITDVKFSQTTEPDRTGPLFAVAREIKPSRLIALHTSGKKISSTEIDHYQRWLEENLKSSCISCKVELLSIADGEDHVMDFEWLWKCIDGIVAEQAKKEKLIKDCNAMIKILEKR